MSEKSAQGGKRDTRHLERRVASRPSSGEQLFEPERGLWARNASKEDLLSILENAPCGIVINKRPFGKVLYINHATFDLSGYSIQDIPTGRASVKIFVDREDKQSFVDSKRQILTTGKVRNIKNKIVCKSGDVKVCEVRSVTLGNGMAVGMWTDVTRQEEAEAHLKEREALFRSLFEESSDAILLLEKGVILDCNTAARQLLHSEKKESITGTTLAQISPRRQADDQLSRKKIGDAFLTALKNKSCRVEWALRRIDGEHFPAEVTITAITLRGKQMFFVVLREITAWKKAEQALLKIRDKLEDRVKERTSRLISVNKQLREEIQARKRIEKELQRSREELRYLSEHLQRVREEEGTRIAREVHDELGQTLSALKIDVTCLGRSIDGNDSEHRSVLEQTKSMEQQIDGAIQTVREICSELRPPILDHFGLPATVDWYLKDFQRRTGIRCYAALDAEITFPDKKMAFVLFRILQEAMTNILRHSGATTVKVRLVKRPPNLLFTVTDNGKGISRKDITNPRSFGIIGIRERVRFWGGQSTFMGNPEKGTTLTISIPLNRSQGTHEPGSRGYKGRNNGDL